MQMGVFISRSFSFILIVWLHFCLFAENFITFLFRRNSVQNPILLSMFKVHLVSLRRHIHWFTHKCGPVSTSHHSAFTLGNCSHFTSRPISRGRCMRLYLLQREICPVSTELFYRWRLLVSIKHTGHDRQVERASYELVFHNTLL